MPDSSDHIQAARDRVRGVLWHHMEYGEDSTADLVMAALGLELVALVRTRDGRHLPPGEDVYRLRDPEAGQA